MADPLILEHFLPYRLNRLAAEVSRELQAVYKPRFGLTVPEWRTIVTLGEVGTMTASAIGAHAAMHKTKVSRAVHALVARRWVERQSNPADRREALLALSRQGRGVYSALAVLAHEYERDFLDGLTEQERATVASALTIMEARARLPTAGAPPVRTETT